MGFMDSTLLIETKFFLGAKGGWEGIVDVEKTLKT